MSSTTGHPTRASRGANASEATQAAHRVGWLVGPMMLAGSIAVVLLVTRGADRAFAVALAVLGALAFAWMLVSVFWPASADRTCPDCGAEGLERHDATTLHGVTCTRCGSTDLERSSFLFAEEDGRPLEPCVTRERQGTR